MSTITKPNSVFSGGPERMDQISTDVLELIGAQDPEAARILAGEAVRQESTLELETKI